MRRSEEHEKRGDRGDAESPIEMDSGSVEDKDMEHELKAHEEAFVSSPASPSSPGSYAFMARPPTSSKSSSYRGRKGGSVLGSSQRSKDCCIVKAAQRDLVSSF